MLYVFAAVLFTMITLVFVAGFGLAAASRRVTLQLGLTDTGRLRPCPTTPNAVNSEDPSSACYVPPLPFDDAPGDAMARLAAMLDGHDHMTVVTRKATYIHAEARSRFFGFVDDVEFRLSPAEHVIHIRSQSRVGRSDLDLNRQRAQSLRALWQTQKPRTEDELNQAD